MILNLKNVSINEKEWSFVYDVESYNNNIHSNGYITLIKNENPFTALIYIKYNLMERLENYCEDYYDDYDEPFLISFIEEMHEWEEFHYSRLINGSSVNEYTVIVERRDSIIDIDYFNFDDLPDFKEFKKDHL